MDLGTIEEEAAACRAAFAAVADDPAYHDEKGRGFALHVHHEIVFETLYFSPNERIDYILEHKPEDERALRLRLMRPLTGEQAAELRRVMNEAYSASSAAREAAWNAYRASEKTQADSDAYGVAMTEAWDTELRTIEEAHRPLCDPDCPWNGTIFPKAET